VKSPFSQSALFGLMVVDMVASVLCEQGLVATERNA
jgi:hypothetical protein